MAKGRKFTAKVAFPTVVSSGVFYQDGVTITKAKLSASHTGDIIFFLSADNGSHWEQVTNGVTHTFTNTGTQLKWKAVGRFPAELTRLEVNYNP